MPTNERTILCLYKLTKKIEDFEKNLKPLLKNLKYHTSQQRLQLSKNQRLTKKERKELKKLGF